MHSGARAPQLEREKKNPHATTREKPACCNEEPMHHNERYCMPQLRHDAAKKKKTKKQTLHYFTINTKVAISER